MPWLITTMKRRTKSARVWHSHGENNLAYHFGYGRNSASFSQTSSISSAVWHNFSAKHTNFEGLQRRLTFKAV